MKPQSNYRVTALAAALLTLVVTHVQAANLVLTINKTTGQIDWLNGFSISKTTGLDDNRFGTFLTEDASIVSPLLLYSGAGSHSRVSFDFSLDGATIQGIGLATSAPPGNPATFSGTAAGAATPIFLLGNFSQFTALNNGVYILAPAGPWNGGIEVQVVPEPNAGSLIAFGSLGLFLVARHRAQRA